MQTKKRIQATKILDVACNALDKHGRFEKVENLESRYVSCQIGDFDISIRTPFQQEPIDWEFIRQCARRGLYGAYREKQKGYNLDIWKGKKVFGVAWDDAADLDIYNFQRGDWETEFLQLFND